MVEGYKARQSRTTLFPCGILFQSTNHHPTNDNGTSIRIKQDAYTKPPLRLATLYSKRSA